MAESFIPLAVAIQQLRTSARGVPEVLQLVNVLPTTLLQHLESRPCFLHEGRIGSEPLALLLTLAQADTLRASLWRAGGTGAKPWKAGSILALSAFASPPAPVRFDTGDGLARRLSALKQQADQALLEKAAKALKVARIVWEQMKMERRGCAFSLDVEKWEMNQDTITEVGWSLLHYRGNRETRGHIHYVVEENQIRRNGRYCPDAREHFDFGTTEKHPAATISHRLATNFAHLPKPLLIMCHDPRSDLTALQMLGIAVDDFNTDLAELLDETGRLRTDGAAKEGIWLVDTQKLYSAFVGDKKQSSLETCCAVLRVPTQRLHNAGNDAVYTLNLFELLMDRNSVPPPAGSQPPINTTPKRKAEKCWTPPPTAQQQTPTGATPTEPW